MAEAEIIPLGEAVRNEILCELAKAKRDSPTIWRCFALRVAGAIRSTIARR
jgi:hypothetical protein